MRDQLRLHLLTIPFPLIHLVHESLLEHLKVVVLLIIQVLLVKHTFPYLALDLLQLDILSQLRHPLAQRLELVQIVLLDPLELLLERLDLDIERLSALLDRENWRRRLPFGPS